MRLSFFLTVFMVTFIASMGCAQAEIVPDIDLGIRGLHVSAEVQEERDFGSVITSAISSVKGKVTTASGKLTDAAKLTNEKATKLWKILTNPEKAMAAFQVSDDEIARMSTIIKKANTEGGLADDEVAKLAKVFAAAQKSTKATDDQVLSIAKMMANAKKTNEAFKASDDEVRKVSDMFKTASSGRATKYTDDEVAKLSKTLAEAQKAAALTDNQMAKLVNMFAEAKQLTSLSQSKITKMALALAPVAKKDKRSWDTLKDVIVTTLGVATGGAILYGVYKLSSPYEVSTI